MTEYSVPVIQIVQMINKWLLHLCMHVFIIIQNNFKCVYHKLVIFKKITHDKLPTCKL